MIYPNLERACSMGVDAQVQSTYLTGQFQAIAVCPVPVAAEDERNWRKITACNSYSPHVLARGALQPATCRPALTK